MSLKRCIVTVVGAFLLAVLVLAGHAFSVQAAPAAPIDIPSTQPDGTKIVLRLWGDEWNHGYETLDGYTVIQEASGYWVYAAPAPGGTLAPAKDGDAALVVGKDSPAGLAKHVRSAGIEPPARQPAERGQNFGTQPVLLVLVDYSNNPHTYAETGFQTSFFGATNSIADYYKTASFNNLTIGKAAETYGTANDGVIGWLRLAGNFDLYPNLDYRVIARDALTAANPYVNYATYDTDGNGYLTSTELHLIIVVAGIEQSSCGETCWGVWAHRWTIDTDYPLLVLDGKTIATDSSDGKYGGYAMFGEIHGAGPDDPNQHPATIGVMIHELGHDLSWPDLYDADGNTQGYWEGAGEWSIMGSGSWNFVPGSTQPGGTPALPDAWLKAYQGWMAPVAATNNSTYNIPTAASNAYALQLGANPSGIDWDFYNHSGTGEYWLVENRQKTGYDAGLPGCGLVIWHIDETVTDTNYANGNPDFPLVAVEEADGWADLYTGFNRGDAGDPYPGTSNKLSFGAFSNPNSSYHNGASSNHSVSLVTTQCTSTMQVQYTNEVTAMDQFIYLPVIIRPPIPYTGTVVSNATPLPGIKVSLAYSTDGGYNWSMPYQTTTTDANGQFSFNNPPVVGGSKMMSAYYDNTTNSNSAYLYFFECNTIDSTSDPHNCTMNIKDTVLSSPGNNASVGSSINFTWNKRSTNTDNYHWAFYFGQFQSTSYIRNLGYVGSVRVNFCGFDKSYTNAWWIDVSTPYGYGIGYDTHTLKFSSMPACSPAPGADGYQMASGQFKSTGGSSLFRWLLSQGEVLLQNKVK